jgi:hypothetical protein
MGLMSPSTSPSDEVVTDGELLDTIYDLCLDNLEDDTPHPN